MRCLCVRCGSIYATNEPRRCAYVAPAISADRRDRPAAVAVQASQGQGRRHVSSPRGGPGTELSRLLKRFGIEPTPTCACRAKAAQMDAWGPDECSKPERIDEVVAVMRAEAEARGLPFVDLAAKLLIKRAIHNARKAAQADKME